MSSPAFRRAKSLKRARRRARNVLRHFDVNQRPWWSGGRPWWGTGKAERQAARWAGMPRRVTGTRTGWRRRLSAR